MSTIVERYTRRLEREKIISLFYNVLKDKVLSSHLRSNKVKGEGAVFWFSFICHGSNSSRYGLLNLYSNSVKGPGVSSLCRSSFVISYPEGIDSTRSEVR